MYALQMLILSLYSEPLNFDQNFTNENSLKNLLNVYVAH